MSEIITYLDDEIVEKYKSKLLHIKNNWQIFKDESQNIPLKDFTVFNSSSYDNNYWNVYIIKKDNQKIDTKNYAPNTFKLLSELSFTNVVFSILKPNTNINLHKDTLNSLYRSHLGLDVPDDYQFFCNESNVTTKNGEINFFDLTHYHEGFNKSEKNRLVLLIDILKIEYINSITYDKNLFRRFAV